MRIARSCSWRIFAAAVVLALAACGRATLPNDEAPPAPRPSNSATAADWKGQNAGQAEELFVGRFPGVSVYRVEGGLRVQIRGVVSVNADTQPLFVVDGMTIDPGPGGALMGINPNDIEKIEVLKDVGSTSLWGVRGANGVILITTKRAR